MIDLEAIRARWSAAHDDDTLVRSLSEGELRACVVSAIVDIDALLREVERMHGKERDTLPPAETGASDGT